MPKQLKPKFKLEIYSSDENTHDVFVSYTVSSEDVEQTKSLSVPILPQTKGSLKGLYNYTVDAIKAQERL